MKINLLAFLLFPLVAFAGIRVESGSVKQPVAIGGGIRLTMPAVQPETATWQSAVLANGGTFNATDVRALDYFVTQCKAKGLWTLLDWVALFAGRNLNAALVPLKRTVGNAIITNNNFIEADFSPTVGLTGNGTSKNLLPGLDRSQCRAANNVSLGVYITVASGGPFLAGLIGGQQNSNLHAIDAAAHNQIVGRINSGGLVNGVVAGSPIIGMCGISRGQPDPDTCYAFSPSGDGTLVQGAGVGPAAIAIFARNTEDFYAGSLGGAWMGAGLTSAQRADFNSIWDTTMNMLGRPTP